MNAPLNPAIAPNFLPFPPHNTQVALSAFQRIAIEAANGAAVLRNPAYMPRDPVETAWDTRGLPTPTGDPTSMLSPRDFPTLPTTMSPPSAVGGDFSALAPALEIFKSYPEGKVRSEGDRRRLLTALAFTLGYLEARGMASPESTLSLIVDAAADRDTSFAGIYSTLVQHLDQLVNGDHTRGFWDSVIELGRTIVKVGRKVLKVVQDILPT